MQQTADNKSIKRITWMFLLLGGLFTFFSCGALMAGIALDLFGTETRGKMTNISHDSGRSDNPFTAQVTFTTANGEDESFISWEDSFYFDLDENIQRSGSTAPFEGVRVRYFEAFPAIAKVVFVYHAEYVNQIVWLFWSGVVLMAGFISRRNKPFTIDLSQRNK